MVVWVLFVNYGYLHGVYSSRELALKAAQIYLYETIEDEDFYENCMKKLQESFDKNEEVFNLDNYIIAEACKPDEEFEDEVNS